VSAPPARVVVLNGTPRAGKSSIAAALQDDPDEAWIGLGVDVARATTPPRLQPGIGLRPGEPDDPAAPYVPVLHAALWAERWQDAVHAWAYDLEVDTSKRSPAECAAAIRRRLADGPPGTRFARLATFRA
jgi:chloramphenicol 3-O-phosphotransferase